MFRYIAVLMCFLLVANGEPTRFSLTTTSTSLSPSPFPPDLRACCGSGVDSLEPSRGQFNLAVLKQWMALAASHGSTFTYTIQSIPYWMSGLTSGGSAPPDDLTVTASCQGVLSNIVTTNCKYKEFITTIAQLVSNQTTEPVAPVNCPNFDYLEMGNEWNTDSTTKHPGTGFNGTSKQWAIMSNDATIIIRKYCSNTKVLAGSVSSIVGYHANGESSQYDVFMGNYLTAWKAIPNPSLPDGVSIHIYCCRGNVTNVPFPTSLASENSTYCTGSSNSYCYIAVKDQVNVINNLLKTLGLNLPVYSTEGGFGTLSQICGPVSCTNTDPDTIFLRASYVSQYMILVAIQHPVFDMLYACCDATWGDYEYGGWYYAFTQTQTWLNKVVITGNAASSSVSGGNVWTVPVTVNGSTAQIVWFDGWLKQYTITTTYKYQQTLDNKTNILTGTALIDNSPSLIYPAIPSSPTGLAAKVE